MHFVDLTESFLTHIYLQNLASIQPRTSLSKFIFFNSPSYGSLIWDLIFTYFHIVTPPRRDAAPARQAGPRVDRHGPRGPAQQRPEHRGGARRPGRPAAVVH